jgi:hypothetical protein
LTRAWAFLSRCVTRQDRASIPGGFETLRDRRRKEGRREGGREGRRRRKRVSSSWRWR